jgi:hypothetical protein
MQSLSDSSTSRSCGFQDPWAFIVPNPRKAHARVARCTAECRRWPGQSKEYKRTTGGVDPDVKNNHDRHLLLMPNASTPPPSRARPIDPGSGTGDSMKLWTVSTAMGPEVRVGLSAGPVKI